MKEEVIVIGGGINGLVASNYLQREGFNVTLLERKEKVGGACVSDSVNIQGQEYLYPEGATALGLMQKFVFQETGLADRVQVYDPKHAKIVYFNSCKKPVYIHRDPTMLKIELRNKVGERGDLRAFRQDEARVISFLQRGYREAKVPTVEDAIAELGLPLTKLWITGSAENLLNCYFTSQETKMYMGMTVIESGPTSYYSPYSAFNIPLMDSGSVMNGYWGFVRGGIWRITEELEKINRSLGVKIITSARVIHANPQKGQVIYSKDKAEMSVRADYLIFATDPMTTADSLCDYQPVRGKNFMGTSGKLIMVFSRPVEWKGITEAQDSESAFRFIFPCNSLADMEKSSQRAASGDSFNPSYYQIYCEGAGQRQFGENTSLHSIVVFIKSLGVAETAQNLSHIRDRIRAMVSSRIKNEGDFVWSRFLTPRDLKDLFYFPGGNIDHTLLANGQNFFDRNYSSDPKKSFYQFGEHENVFYCGAGSYPCGSVAGTPGYMCAKQLIGTNL